MILGANHLSYSTVNDTSWKHRSIVGAELAPKIGAMKDAYAAIGRAVVAAQLFETTLIPIFEFFKMHTKPGYLEKTAGYVSAGAFKVPIKSIVNILSEHGDIAPDLEERLTAYAEDRHILIHRWIQQHGWPADEDVNGFVPIIDLANRVNQEARDLTRLFVGYILKFATPDGAEIEPDDRKLKIAEMFKRVHVRE